MNEREYILDCLEKIAMNAFGMGGRSDAADYISFKSYVQENLNH